MSTLTPNYGLIKATGTEQYNVDIVNANLDAVDSALGTHEVRLDSLNEAGIWTTYAAQIRVDGAGGAAAGTTVAYSKWTRIGKTVHVIGEGSTTTLVSNVTVLLPTTPGLSPRRTLLAGHLLIFGAAPPTQSGIARMTTDFLRVQAVTLTNAFVDLPANHSIQWDLTYEVA